MKHRNKAAGIKANHLAVAIAVAFAATSVDADAIALGYCVDNPADTGNYTSCVLDAPGVNNYHIGGRVDADAPDYAAMLVKEGSLLYWSNSSGVNATNGAHGLVAQGIGARLGVQYWDTWITVPTGPMPVNVTGTGTAVMALNGGRVELGQNVIRYDLGYGLNSEGAGSAIAAEGTTVLGGVPDTGAFALVAQRGGTLFLKDGNASSPAAAVAVADGLGSLMELDHSVITGGGAGVYTVNAQNGATLRVVNGSSIVSSGASAYGARAYGEGTELIVDSSAVTSAGLEAYGVVAGGYANVKIINGSTVDTQDSLFGVAAIDRDTQLEISDSAVKASGATIAAVGAAEGAKVVLTNAVLQSDRAGIFMENTEVQDGVTQVFMTGGRLTSGPDGEGAVAAIHTATGRSEIVLTGVDVQLAGTHFIDVVGASQLDATLSGITVTGDIKSEGALVVRLTDSSHVTGMVNGHVEASIDAGSTWTVGANEQSAASTLSMLTLGGTMAYSSPNTAYGQQYKTVSTAGFRGNGGTIVLNTELGDDSSATDKLIIDGDRSGNAYLRINNNGGAGALTTADGIQVVQAYGPLTPGLFALDGRVVAGAYEYELFEGSKTDAGDASWYLRSEAPYVAPEPEVPTDPVVPTDPEDPADPEGQTDPGDLTDPQEPNEPVVPIVPNTTGDGGRISVPTELPRSPVYRPDIGAYLGNQRAATAMFNHTLHDRVGQQTFAAKPEGDARGGAVWTRVNRVQFDGVSGAAQVDSSTDTDLVQVGGELTGWTEGDRRFHIGLMGGIGRANTQAVSTITGHVSQGRVKGTNIGVYGTWYASATEPTGLYVDSWLQYARFDNSLSSDQLEDVSYDSQSLNASLEAGYAWRIRSSDSSETFLQPQVQVIYNGLSSDRFSEANGTRFDSRARGLTTRVGAKLYGNATDTTNAVQPFVEANWWHSENGEWIALNETRVSWDMPTDVYELKIGVQMELGGDWTGWGHFDLRAADGDYRHVGGQVGLMKRW